MKTALPLAFALSRASVRTWNTLALRGRSILVVENEMLIAMDIAKALEDAGANATMTTTVRHALILIEHDGLAAPSWTMG